MVGLKKIAIFCVTYNSYQELDTYIKSLLRSYEGVEGKILMDVFVGDNTETELKNPVFPERHGIRYYYYHYSDNPGYFGAVNRAMSGIDISQYYYVVISNVDLVIDDSFFMSLLSKDISSDVGWIATSLYSCKEHRDRNPEITNRYSRLKLILLALKFRIPLLDAFYNKTLYKRKRVKPASEPGEIYAGHGSFILLTNSYMERCGIINYPMFLFCEELYLAENCRRSGLKVLYDPSLHVIDAEHVSSAKIKRGIIFRKSAYYKYNYNSVIYILNTFYR